MAQNYIHLLVVFLESNRKMTYEAIHRMLTRNMSQATSNLLRSRLIYDLDYSVAKHMIEGGECEDCCLDSFWNQEEDDREGIGYNEYLEENPFYGCCYK